MKNELWFVFTLLCAISFGLRYDPPASFTKKDLLRRLDTTTGNRLINKGKSVALGYNANVDVVVKAVDLLEAAKIPFPVTEAANTVESDKLQVHPTIVAIFPSRVVSFLEPYLPKKLVPKTPGKDHGSISTSQELSEVFVHFMSGARAAERPIRSPELFQNLLTALESIKNVNSSLGGNAALMALTMHNRHGLQVVLGGQAGPKVRSHLPESLHVVAANPEKGRKIAGKAVDVQLDEVHIIMEYPAGQEWGGATAERANRFIVSRDMSNNAIASLEALNAHVVKHSNYDLLVIAGLHMMDGMEKEFRSKRVQDLVSTLSQVYKTKTLIHCELASIGDKALVQLIAREVLNGVDSIGLNEQELFSLYDALGGVWKDTTTASTTSSEEKLYTKEDLTQSVPDVKAVQKMMEFVFQNIRASSNSRLSRIHFHCYGYHIIAEIKNQSPWKRAREAVACGSVTATEQACQLPIAKLHGNQLDIKLVSATVESDDKNKPQLQLEVNETMAVLEWSKGKIDYHLAPVLVCVQPVSTVGLGDAISSSALAIQI